MRALVKLFLVVVLCAGQYAEAVAQQPGPIVPDVIYGHKAGMALTFDVFKPNVASNGAGVLYMVSGGWVSTWRDPEIARNTFAPWLNAGFTVFAVRHGSSPQFKVPEAYADVKRAVRYIHLHAKEWGVDENRLGATGGSAGGHLSLMLGNTGDDGDSTARDPVLRGSSKIAAVVAYFPPVDLRRMTGPSDRFPALNFDSTLAASVSPIVFVSPDDPPTLLVHGTADALVPDSHSKLIYAAFKLQNVASNLILIEGAGHGFQGAAATQASEASVKWFTQYLAKK